eukprot:gene26041-32642_t
MATMHAVQYRAYSADLENLEIVTVPKPVPGEGQVLVKIFVAAGNQIDLYLYYGIMRSNRWRMYFPFTPGYDFSGVVDALGPGVSKFDIGEEVFGVHWGPSRHDNPKDPNASIAGCFAEYLVVHASML